MDEENRTSKRLEPVKNAFEFYGVISIVFGIVYTFCRYNNPSGITYPLFVGAAYGAAILVLRHSHKALKRGSRFVMGISLLLAVSTCRTGSWVIHWLNSWAIVFLSAVFVIHQTYEDRKWNIGKYFVSILCYLFTSLCCIGYPFVHMTNFLKNAKNKNLKNISMIGLGALFGIPAIFMLAGILASADIVFDRLFDQFLTSFLRPWTLIKVVSMAVGGAVGIYGLICGAVVHNMKEQGADRRKYNPVTAISFMGMIAVLYLMFSLVQIFYLFLAKGSLPEGVTYAKYAHQGFFQLVSVAFLNLVMVLCCLKYFKKSRILNVILTIVCLCTYIMILSAAYRMILYVGEYRLTFLRVFVLWFLALLSVLMVGVVIIIYKNEFPLFRYCLAAVSVFYLGFAWARPDYGIAKYNVAHMTDENRWETMHYLCNKLSSDAAPVIVELSGQGAEEEKQSYFLRMEEKGKRMSIRSYNFSLAKALKY